MTIFRIAQRASAVALFGLLAHLPAMAQERGAELRVGRSELPPSLGNPFTTVGLPPTGVWTALYDGLTLIDQDGSLAPALALSWEAETPTRWVFRLREDAGWQGGGRFTAQDAAAVIRFLQTEAAASLYVATEVSGITAIETPDEATLVLETAEPDAILPRRFNIVYFPHPDLLGEGDLDRLTLEPRGTGPFAMQDWGRTSGTTTLTAATESWRAPVAVEQLRLVHIPDAAGRLNALLSGQLDVSEAVGPDEEALLRDRGFRVERRPVPAVTGIAFRLEGNPDTPLQDPRVRIALNHAVDKQAIAEVILAGAAQPAGQGAAPMTFGYNPDLAPIPYDPERARALLAEAGHPDGFAIEMEVLTGLGANDSLTYQQVAQNLRAVGIDVTLRTPPFPTWLQKYLSGDWGDVDAFSFLWDSGAYNDAIRPIRNYSCLKPNPFFCDPELMPLIEASMVEVDQDRRAAMLGEIMARMQANPPSIWLVSASVGYAVSDRVATFAARPHGIMYERIEFRE